MPPNNATYQETVEALAWCDEHQAVIYAFGGGEWGVSVWEDSIELYRDGKGFLAAVKKLRKSLDR